jgi:plasmid stabilization system protein ParE
MTLANSGLLSIGAYSLHTWGEDRTVHYFEELEARCRMLANNPGLGRADSRRYTGSGCGPDSGCYV